MKKLIIVALIFAIGFITAIYLGLTHSSRFNNFVFSNVVNPYDPLKVQTSQPATRQIEQNDYWEDPRGLFPIFAYNIPDKTKDLTASLKIIERGGINIIINSNLGWIDDANKVNKAFEKIKSPSLKWIVLIENECKDDFIFRNANNEINKNIKKYLKKFNNDYVYGWYLWDEPGSNRKPCTLLNFEANDDNADISVLANQIRSDTIFNKQLDFVNLFPTYWDGTPTAEDYEKYIDAFIASQEYKPRVLCFDHYPFLITETGGFRKDYYLNLQIIRKKSLQYEVPFWMIVLSSGHLSYKNPTFEEISFQVYSALAYGAKGIGYYLYSKGLEQVGYTSWILEDNVDNPNVVDSLHGPLFVPVKKLNEEVQSLGKILNKLESIKIIHTSDYPNYQKGISKSLLNNKESNAVINKISINETDNLDPKILIGVFKEKLDRSLKGDYLLIVNKNIEEKVRDTIYIDNERQIFKFDKETGERIFITKSNNFDIFLLPGDGELFYIK